MTTTTTTIKKAGLPAGLTKHFDSYSTRVALLLTLLSATSAVGVALIGVLAWRLIGGAL